MAKKGTARSARPETLTEFIEEFARYFSGSSHLKCYRGQRDSSWPTGAGILRPEFRGLLEEEKTAVRKLISVQPHEFAPDETMFDKLVRMQHFGLPTRLLDVSRNALVALFFATGPGPRGKPTDGVVTAFAIPPQLEKYYDSDSVSCIANLANMTSEEKTEIYRLIESLSGDPLDLLVPYYVHPKMSNRRILAQSGAFILYGIVPPKARFFPYVIEETHFVVPQAEKSRIREALDNIGINESTLFPEIDRAAARIRNSYTK
jgi:hypothetical protein